jgi:hypothetical protein
MRRVLPRSRGITIRSNIREIGEKSMAQIQTKPPFTPLAQVPSSTAESLWTRIFAFATSPGDPDALNLSALTANRAALCSINFTRKSLTLVSKQFHVGLDFTLPNSLFPVRGLSFRGRDFCNNFFSKYRSSLRNGH